MSALGSSTYLNANTPLFAPLNGAGGISVSSITASGPIIDQFSAVNQFAVINASGTQAIQNVTVSTINNAISQIITNNTGTPVSAYTSFAYDGSASLVLSDGANNIKARIDFSDNVGGGNGGVGIVGENLEKLIVGNGKVEVLNADFQPSTINGLPYPTPLTFPIYNLTPGSAVNTNGTTPVVVATQASSVAGKAYRVTVVYDVTCVAPTAATDYSELQITGTGVSIFSLATAIGSDLLDTPVIPGQSKTASAVFVDADGGGFNLEIIANAAAPTQFDYTFYSVAVERLN